MPQLSDALLADPGLRRADYRVHEWGNEPGSEIWRAGITHEVMMRMLESAEALAPFLKLSRDVVFAVLRDLVIEGAERSPFGLVASEPEGQSERALTTPGPGGTPGRRSASAESTGGDGRE